MYPSSKWKMCLIVRVRNQLLSMMPCRDSLPVNYHFSYDRKEFAPVFANYFCFLDFALTGNDTNSDFFQKNKFSLYKIILTCEYEGVEWLVWFLMEENTWSFDLSIELPVNIDFARQPAISALLDSPMLTCIMKFGPLSDFEER